MTSTGGLRGVLSRWRIAVLLILAAVGWGLMGLKQMGKESWPDVEMPLGFVQAVYPGASPELVEAEVSNILEAKLKGLPGMVSLDSSSVQNVSLVLVEFDLDADPVDSMGALRDGVAEAEAELPDEVEITVTKVATSNQPIYSFSLSGGFPPEVLRTQALALQSRLEGLGGVNEVRISGLRDDQLQVLVHQRRLEEIGGTLTDVVSALEDSQNAAPVGDFESAQRTWPLDVDRVALDPVALGQLQVRSAASGDTVSLASVAMMKRALSEPTEQTRLIRRDGDILVRGDAVSFDILRQSGANVPEVVAAVRAELDEARADLPDSMELTVTTDRGAEIVDGLNMLMSNAGQAVLLVFIVLFGVLGLSESLIAGLSIPITFLLTFGVLHSMGQSLNNLSLMGLVIALGLLVDDFILMMEGMHEELEQGQGALEAAVATLKNYALPSLSGSLTTIAAFMPMAMLGGLEGRFIQVIPLTICIALVTSYLVSISLDAMVGAAVLKHQQPNPLTRLVGRAFTAVQSWYERRVFPATLARPGRRWAVMVVTVLVFGSSLAVATQLETILYPATDESQLGATFHLPPGSTLSVTQQLSTRVEALLSEDPHIQHAVLTAGQKSGLAMNGPEAYLEPFKASHLLGLTLELVPLEERDGIPSYELAEGYRTQLEALAPGKVEIHQIRMGATGAAPIELQIRADSSRRAEALADQVIEIIEGVEGTHGVADSRKPHQGAQRIALHDEALAHHSLDRNQVLQFLYYAIGGTTADTVYTPEGEVDLEVSYDWRDDGIWNAPSSLEEILALQVPKMMGGTVSLAGIADLELKSSPIGINHTARSHVVTVTAEALGSPVDAAKAIADGVAKLQLAQGEDIDMLGDQAKSAETSKELGRALLLALAMIFCILVTQFRSFVQPVVILVSMPLAMTGVFFGFAVVGIPLSFPAMIGMVALAGIVVNDAIVLIDAINRGRWDDGLSPVEAVLQGCTSRMRPIIVTTLTTTIGLMPLALTDAVWEGLCMAIVFGISLATVLTMVVIPALYLLLERAGSMVPASEAAPAVAALGEPA